VSNWFKELGEKAGRTDVWVILICLTWLLSTSTIILMNLNVISFNQYIYDQCINLLYLLLGGLFADLGIDIWKQIKLFKFNNETSNQPYKK